MLWRIGILFRMHFSDNGSGNAMLPLMLHFLDLIERKSIERNVVDFLNYSPVVGMLLLLVD